MKIAPIFFALPAMVAVAGYATMPSPVAAKMAKAAKGKKAAKAAPMAHAALMAGDGSARGTAEITEAADGLHVVVKAMGLVPGIHAVHVHTTGVCTAPDFASAGGHWNPAKHQHGKENPAGMHMGDMPNMTVDAQGAGSIEYVIPAGLLSTGATPLLDADGAAIVIHAQADDYKTDPTGNAGGRLACGVIKAE